MRAFIFFLAIFTCLNLYAYKAKKLVIRAAVAEEFKDGLHSKYLKYFADKLNVTLELSTMPFARRLRHIENGQLDLIVGIQKTEERQDEFVYILPHYELLSHRIFTLKENHHQIKSYQDLAGKHIGINHYSKYFQRFDNDENINKFRATGVVQNIELLLRGRIDAFIHYEESTLPLLSKMGKKGKITKSLYQPDYETLHYLAISSHSKLATRQDELKLIVEQAIKNNDLLNIRLDHYADIYARSAALPQQHN
ncbi:substrate-binding periplasmic protein [Cognaticolwellia mytili]|uniref:substrate-binding periplasmic protein n=1 Tax=Cognaticolwellia mytili TaxID=1888913 RepID=UPI000A17440C|nr:transporter substrate-binding domain-containing protein [Cognaticolwellia mytili]